MAYENQKPLEDIGQFMSKLYWETRKRGLNRRKKKLKLRIFIRLQPKPYR